MMQQYDALPLLQGMISTNSAVVGAFNRYLTLGSFPEVVPNARHP